VLQQPLNGYEILMTIVNSYVALLAICAIQFWLGLRFRNFVVPIAIGLSCWFAGTVLVMGVQAGFATYFPYSFHIYPNVPEYKSQLSTIHWASVGYAVAFILVGFFDFTKRAKR
ncbi:MAG TPA: hypothetical protein VD794_17160, partial [Flavisolibacter sp.]|nr:hypothetical protein [Flavisolibacter sp.]